MKSKTIVWASLVALAACAGMIATASTWAQVASPASAEPPAAATPPAASSDSAPAATNAAASRVPSYYAVEYGSPIQRSEARLRMLLAKYTKLADEKARAECRAEMTKLLEQEFDARQKACEEDLAQLEAQVKRLRDLLQKRQQAQQEIVKSRLDQLVREAEGLGWPAPMGAGSTQGPYGPAAGYSGGAGYPGASPYGMPPSDRPVLGGYSVPGSPKRTSPPPGKGATK